MKRRRPDPRRAKIHRSYDVADIAKLFDVHRNTVRSWLKQGLRAIEGLWPTLVLGAELRRFLTEKQGKRTRRLQGAVANVVGIRRGAISGNMSVSAQAARSIG